jgi:hypothetical protein
MQRKSDICSFVASLLVLACMGASTPESLPEGVVSKVVGDQRPVTITKTELSSDRTAATVWFTSSLGIFAFTFQPGDLPLKTVTFVIEQQKYCEGLTFSPKSGKALDLRETDGVQVAVTNGNVRIEVRSPAIDQLKQGGRIQYVNQYR